MWLGRLCFDSRLVVGKDFSFHLNKKCWGVEFWIGHRLTEIYLVHKPLDGCDYCEARRAYDVFGRES